jgi:hypothetical protein
VGFRETLASLVTQRTIFGHTYFVPQVLSAKEICDRLDQIERSKALISADSYRVNCPTLTESEIARIVDLVCATRIRLIAERALRRLQGEDAREILGEFEAADLEVRKTFRRCSLL